MSRKRGSRRKARIARENSYEPKFKALNTLATLGGLLTLLSAPAAFFWPEIAWPVFLLGLLIFAQASRSYYNLSKQQTNGVKQHAKRKR